MDRAVIFDVGGVLLDYERDSMLRSIADGCLAGTDPEHVSSLIGELDLSGGEMTLAHFHVELKQRYDCSLSKERLDEVWVEGLSPRSWVPAFLREVRQKAELYILSDTNAEHWQHIADHILPLDMFSQIFLSHELRMTKKTPAVFNHVLGEIPYTADACLFIDDTSANIDVANSVGLRTHHYQDQANLIRELNTHFGL